MNRRWLIHIVLRSIGYRKGRSLLLLAVLAMASSLVTSLGMVSATMEERVAEEVRRYGANLVLLPESARLDVGSGGLSFGAIAEPAFLSQVAAESLMARHKGEVLDYSLHLQGALKRGDRDMPVEGVRFDEIRRLFPWWNIQGRWPAGDEAIVGVDLARELRLKPGDSLPYSAASGAGIVVISGIVATGGDEDRLLFVPLPMLQRAMGLDGQVTEVRILARTGGRKLAEIGADMQRGLAGARISEVRQVARTSEGLLKKVQLLMLLVTLVVLLASAGSVASTLSTTVLERGREIGLLKAIGGARRGVLLLFSLEGVAFGVAGGGAGYLAGVAIAQLVVRTVFDAWCEFMPLFILHALGVSLFLALLGGLGPMISVYRLDPVQSLRGE